MHNFLKIINIELKIIFNALIFLAFFTGIINQSLNAQTNPSLNTEICSDFSILGNFKYIGYNSEYVFEKNPDKKNSARLILKFASVRNINEIIIAVDENFFKTEDLKKISIFNSQDIVNWKKLTSDIKVNNDSNISITLPYSIETQFLKIEILDVEKFIISKIEPIYGASKEVLKIIDIITDEICDSFVVIIVNNNIACNCQLKYGLSTNSLNNNLIQTAEEKKT